MEVKGLFEILAGYLDFLLDFITLKGMDPYARTGAIHPTLVAYFVAGVFIAYLVSSVRKMPGYESLVHEAHSERTAQTPPNSEPKILEEVNTVDMAGFVLISILGALLFHGFLLVYCRLLGFSELGTVKDTLNAVFAYNAIYHPLNAFSQQVRHGANRIARGGGACALTAGIILFSMAVLYFASMVFLLYALAAVHGTTIAFMLLPSLLPVIIFFLILALIARAAGVSFMSMFSTPKQTL